MQKREKEEVTKGMGRLLILTKFTLCPQGGSRVSGLCGGYCGKCTPSSDSRLPVAVHELS